VSDDRLRDLYAIGQGGRPAAPGGEHPAPEVIAALVRREGPEEERLATLDHVMSCAECRHDFDLLRAVERAGIESRAAGRTGGKRGWFMPAALAASVLLAVGVGRMVLRAGGDDTTRGDDHGGVALVQPGREAAAGDSLTFSWHAVPSATRYELELLDAGGGVLASAATTDTTASPVAARALPPGDYRWWVRATTSDARSLRSALRPLRLIAR
jgi:hypothetical protein